MAAQAVCKASRYWQMPYGMFVTFPGAYCLHIVVTAERAVRCG